MNNKYPIYIPSKGRWESRYTVKTLEAMNIPYRIIIEEQEYNDYASVIDSRKIIILPFRNQGLIAARCWIMEHSIKEGHIKHWQIDDNIDKFYRFYKNKRIISNSGAIFRAMEDFCDRYINIAYAGPHYKMFGVTAKTRAITKPFLLNTRIYSCTLINNSIPYRWRSIYNDDTDVSLMALKDGWCTVLFYAFLCGKKTTMTVRGGNTEELYLIEDGRLKMAQALQKLHPDVVKITHKWGRWQHQVDYRPFKKNKLIRKRNIDIPSDPNEYGMKLVKLKS
jgi:hypothetical protein